jgi:hypothetical protein
MTQARIEQAPAAKLITIARYEAQVQTTATGLVIPPTNSIQVEGNLEVRKKASRKQ